jgi:hypothetical protein
MSYLTPIISFLGALVITKKGPRKALRVAGAAFSNMAILWAIEESSYYVTKKIKKR